MTVAYLFLPDRQNILRYLIVACYLAAGMLKLKPEWLTGASALRPPPLPYGWLLKFFEAYAAFAELCLSFLLLAESPPLFYFALINFIIFHIVSYQQVGFFFPVAMFCVLSLLPLLRRFPVEQKARFRLSTVLALAAFAIGQCWPLFLSSDAAKTGEGRAFALHMVDARLDCVHTLYAKFEGQVLQVESNFDRFGARRQCDPLVLLNFAQGQCRLYKDVPGFKDLDLYLNVRRQTAAKSSRLIALKDVCAKDLDFSLWQRNSWVLDE